MDMEALMNSEAWSSIVDAAITGGTKVVLAALVLIAGFIVAGTIRKTIRQAALKSETLDDTLGSFFASIAYWAIMAMVLIAVLGNFGIETTGFVAAFGAAGLAIGLALQGTLSNIAAGVMIVFFRPYKLGDFVEAAGQAGSVKDINLFTTELATGDNKKVIVPNGAVWGDVITNYSANGTRRVDFTFSIDYSDDIDQAMKVIEDTLGADKRIHADPAIFVAVSGHGASSVDLVTRVWCDGGDYWGIYFDGLKNVKEAFDKAKISIPYPHQVNINRKA